MCCAVKGRALATALHDPLVGRVWETTHLSGHRFAPTAVLLPSGVTDVRLDPDLALAAFEHGKAGRVMLDGYRGRTTYSRPGQAAEAAVRTASGESDLDALEVVSVREHDGLWHAVLSHRDGRQWRVDVTGRRLELARPESCGAAAGRPMAYEATPPERVE